ncbi:unnamed protein product [Lupinus luteus]|uniref:Uncharacterized protein n=1 Tax=Lupinus luteus TaxID=3873 RepID=A0AAV1YL61_LUPLU
MKKLYRRGTVHPSPPIITDHLSFLPAAIFTLAAALSPEDREVLSYLISCSSNNNFSGNSHRNTANNNNTATATVGDHAPVFHCSCFRCYTSYWVRWDSSPNRELIHEIIDEFEDWLAQQSNNNNNNNKNNKKGKEKRNNKKKKRLNNKKETELVSSVSDVSSELESVESSSNNSEGGGDKVEEEEKGAVRRFVSFIGQSIWGAWGQ